MSDNSTKLISVFLAFSGAVAISSAWAGDIVLSLEEPTANSTYTGVANIRGWVVGSAGIQRVELYVDGTLKTNIPVGGRRSDVGSSYPTYPNSSDSGFSMAYNYSSLNAGQHSIRVRAIDNEGAFKDASATFNATRFDNPFISNPSSINLNAATVSHDSQSIVINNITADGKTYDIRLDWRTAIQNYAITQIVSTGGGSSPSSARWGVISEVCCPNSTLTYSVTVDGVTKKMDVASCTSDDTFEGFATTTAGSKQYKAIKSSSACGNASVSGTVTFTANACYIFDLQLKDGSVYTVIGTVNCPTSSVSSSIKTLQREISEATPTAILPMLNDNRSSSGEDTEVPVNR